MKLVVTLAIFSILTFAFTYNLDLKIQKSSDEYVQAPLTDTTIVFKRGNANSSVKVHYKEYQDTFVGLVQQNRSMQTCRRMGVQCYPC